MWRQPSSWGIPALPKSRPRGAKVRESSKRWPKCIARAILGGPGASPRGTSGDFWSPFRVPRSRRWGLWASFCRPIGCSDFAFSHFCCDVVIFLDLIIIFYRFLVWSVGWIFMFSIAGGASFSSMILVRFFLSLRIAFCIGKTSAKCVLHNKNKGFYTFNVFRTKSNFYIFYRFRHRFRVTSFYDFHDVSKLLEV